MKLVTIGAGNMAEAIIHGLIKAQFYKPQEILAIDISQERLDHFATVFSIATAKKIKTEDQASVYLLAVKPGDTGILTAYKDIIREAKGMVLSIAAGITTTRLENLLGDGARVVRAMPNMPSLVGKGAAAICRGRWATDQDLDLAQKILEAIGTVVRVEEKDMDAVTALSGSGPAYVFYLLESMMEAAKRLGLHEDIVWKLAVGTIEGTAHLCLASNLKPAELRARVTSKGGTTEAAFKVLEERKVFDAFVEAFTKASQRSKELAEEYLELA